MREDASAIKTINLDPAAEAQTLSTLNQDIHPVARRFMRLIQYDTQSYYDTTAYPSTPSQLAFAKRLAEECVDIGLSDVKLDEYGYVTACLPANIQETTPVIGFLAHMDTSPDAPGKDIRPRVVPYEGGTIRLNDERVLSPDEFPHLLHYTGQDIIVADGRTLLGADDKAGIAEILTAMEYLLAHPAIRHGKIRVGFTPDEEVGRGVDHFDVEGFGADYAYTVDGVGLGELEAENFYAARAFFTIKGKSAHPGYAYGTMLNAARVAGEMIACFPENETPSCSKDREGFYHLTNLSGEVSKAVFSYILRDFEPEGFERRKAFVTDLAKRFNERYGPGTVALALENEYLNMREILDNRPEIMERARQAVVNAGLNPIVKPVRGGTDGARLSFMGLPCPNLFTGGHNFHGLYEYIPIPSMEAAVNVIVNICKRDE